ncbi:MAG: glycosyl transferase family 1 [Pseudomonadota bacterium]
MIGYLVHDLCDPAVARRAAMLRCGGADLRLAGFHRDRVPPGLAALDPVVLGRTQDARLMRRAGAVAQTLAMRIDALARHFAEAETLMARNLEMLVIARAVAARTGAAMIYECLDLHDLLLRRGPLAACVRGVERWAAGGAQSVLTSAPAFIRAHLGTLPARTPAILVENKLFPAAPAPARTAPLGPPWRIGWFGALRCRRSMEMLLHLIDRAEGRVELHLAGRPSPAVFPDWTGLTRGRAHVIDLGAYAAGDLGRLYGDVHFNWAVDYYEAGGNSELLLPNRLYEGSAFGAIPILRAGTEAAALVAPYGFAELLPERDPAAALRGFFEALEPDAFAARQAGLGRVPRARWVADAAECRHLLARLTPPTATEAPVYA